MRYQLRVTADPSLRKKYRKLQRWNLLFRQIYGPPGPEFWGMDQWSDRLGGYFTRHGNRNFAIRQVSRLLRVVHRQLRQEGRSVWLLPIDHQSHQRPSFLYGNLRRRFPRRSVEAERRWIMRLRERLLAARKGAEDQESQLGPKGRLAVDETNSFWQQRGFRRRVPLELAHHNLVGARWEDPDRLLLNPHFLQLMRPAVAFLRGSEGMPPAFRAALFRRRQRLGDGFGQLAHRRRPSIWRLRTHYWGHRRRQMLLRRQLRLRLRFRAVRAQLEQLVNRVTAAAQRGTLGPLQTTLGLLPFRGSSSIVDRRSPLGRLAREPHFSSLWCRLRRLCGPSLPADGCRWLRRRLRSAAAARFPQDAAALTASDRKTLRKRESHARAKFQSHLRGQRSLWISTQRRNRERFQLRAVLTRFGHHRRHMLRCTLPGRWLGRRLRWLRQRRNRQRRRQLRKPLRRLGQRQRATMGWRPTAPELGKFFRPSTAILQYQSRCRMRMLRRQRNRILRQRRNRRRRPITAEPRRAPLRRSGGHRRPRRKNWLSQPPKATLWRTLWQRLELRRRWLSERCRQRRRSWRQLRRRLRTVARRRALLESRWEPLRPEWQRPLTLRDRLRQRLRTVARQRRQRQYTLATLRRQNRRLAVQRLKIAQRGRKLLRHWQTLRCAGLHPSKGRGELKALQPVLRNAQLQLSQAQRKTTAVPLWLEQRWSHLQRRWSTLVRRVLYYRRRRTTLRSQIIAFYRSTAELQRRWKARRRHQRRLRQSLRRLRQRQRTLWQRLRPLERRWEPLRRNWETLWQRLARLRRRQRRLGHQLPVLRQLGVRLALQRSLQRQRKRVLHAERRLALSQSRAIGHFRRRLRKLFRQRFSTAYRQPRHFRRRHGEARRWRRLRQRQTRRRRQRRRARQWRRRQRRLLRRIGGVRRPKPVFAVPGECRVTLQRWKTVQRPLPRTLSFRYTIPGIVRTTARWRFPVRPTLVAHRGRLRRMALNRRSSALLPQQGDALRALMERAGADRQRHSSRLPLVHYRVLELTIRDLAALDDDGNELPPERWLVLERTYGPVGYDTLMADLFGVLTPALRLMSKVVGHKSARRTVYHARDGVPLSQRRKLIFGWLRDLVNKNPEYNYLRRNTLRKRPSKRVLLRPERSRRLTEPFRPRLYAELHQLLHPDEPIMERLEDFDEKSYQLRLTRRHYRWS